MLSFKQPISQGLVTVRRSRFLKFSTYHLRIKPVSFTASGFSEHSPRDGLLKKTCDMLRNRNEARIVRNMKEHSVQVILFGDFGKQGLIISIPYMPMVQTIILPLYASQAAARYSGSFQAAIGHHELLVNVTTLVSFVSRGTERCSPSCLTSSVKLDHTFTNQRSATHDSKIICCGTFDKYLTVSAQITPPGLRVLIGNEALAHPLNAEFSNGKSNWFIQPHYQGVVSGFASIQHFQPEECSLDSKRLNRGVFWSVSPSIHWVAEEHVEKL